MTHTWQTHQPVFDHTDVNLEDDIAYLLLVCILGNREFCFVKECSNSKADSLFIQIYHPSSRRRISRHHAKQLEASVPMLARAVEAISGGGGSGNGDDAEELSLVEDGRNGAGQDDGWGVDGEGELGM